MGTFRDATALIAHGGGDFGATLDAQWSVGTKLHGGYLLAVLARAACESSAGERHPHVTAVSGAFVEPPEPGPADVRVEPLRIGKSVAQVRATLAQEGRILLEAHVTLGVLDDADPWWSSLPMVELPPEEDCFLAPTDPPGADFPVPLMGVVEERVDPAHLAFAFGAPSRRGEIASWQRLADGSDWDPLSLLVALDPVPPVAFDLGLPGWVPTIQLSAYVRRLPAPGPIRVRLTATDVGGDRMDEVAHVWDSKGRLVAQATQLAAVRVPD
ncbi:thioesterase family protein [Nonomuraea spiralis]|uniref:thioesterase family protein n=1 Tax=Nonomuraea TaxID=83681 RepID=UPI000F769F87|nr:thioesterase family protein [Nonomuraea sp. WAC 01424]RSN09516.1 thioesterase family protein [Nonomuraea sp. WAC 01424]